MLRATESPSEGSQPHESQEEPSPGSGSYWSGSGFGNPCVSQLKGFRYRYRTCGTHRHHCILFPHGKRDPIYDAHMTSTCWARPQASSPALPLAPRRDRVERKKCDLLIHDGPTYTRLSLAPWITFAVQKLCTVKFSKIPNFFLTY